MYSDKWRIYISTIHIEMCFLNFFKFFKSDKKHSLYKSNQKKDIQKIQSNE